ncbi:MAG: MFS transporter, partial [Asgard group archaeon]|nr:MFS transporter [Asgard group archaeon]
MKNKEMKLGLDEIEKTELIEKQGSHAKEEQTSEDIEINTDASELSNEDTSETENKVNKRLVWATSINLNLAYNHNFIGQQAIAAYSNVNGTLMGLINALPSILNLSQSLFGRLSDRYGRKAFLIIGFIIFTLTSTLMMFFTTPAMLVVIAVIQAIATAMISPVLYATQGDTYHKDSRATTLGRISATAALINMVFSTILTILFYLADNTIPLFGHILNIPTLTQTKVYFIIALSNCFTAFVLMILLKESKSDTDPKKESKSRFVEVFKNKSFMKYILICCAWMFFGYFPWGVFNLVMVNVLNMDFWKISLFITSLTVFRSIIMMISGKLSDKIKKRKPFIVTGALLAPSMAFFVVFSVISGQWWLMFIDLLISSVGLGIINNLIIPYILD